MEIDKNNINITEGVFNTKEELVSSVINDLDNTSNYYQVEDLVSNQATYVSVNKEDKSLDFVKITVENSLEPKGLKVNRIKTESLKLGKEIEVERFSTKNNIMLGRESRFTLNSGDVSEFEKELEDLGLIISNYDRRKGVRVSNNQQSSVGAILLSMVFTIIVVGFLVVVILNMLETKESIDNTNTNSDSEVVSGEVSLSQKEDLVLEELRQYFDTATIYLDDTIYKVVPEDMELIGESGLIGLSKEVEGILGDKYSVGLMNLDDTELLLEAKNGEIVK